MTGKTANIALITLAQVLALCLWFSGTAAGPGMLREARAHGLSGWVRNRQDGSVESLLSGDEAAVRDVLSACRLGPPMARVDELVESFAEAPEEPGLRRLPTA